MSDLVLWETDGKVGLITLNRPRQLNALNLPLLEELESVVLGPAAENHVRAIIITGAGDRAFAAGADIASMRDMDADGAREWSLLGQRVFAAIEDCPKPVIAAINGYALGGGCELTLACDIRLAAEGAVIGQPEVTLGIPPGFGASYRLPAIVGAARAREMILTGKRLDAEAALAAGLVSDVVPAERLLETATRWARGMASSGPAALKAAKRTLSLAQRESAIEREALLFGQTFETGQPCEGMSAFLEKRKAEYS